MIVIPKIYAIKKLSITFYLFPVKRLSPARVKFINKNTGNGWSSDQTIGKKY